MFRNQHKIELSAKKKSLLSDHFINSVNKSFQNKAYANTKAQIIKQQLSFNNQSLTGSIPIISNSS